MFMTLVPQPHCPLAFYSPGKYIPLSTGRLGPWEAPLEAWKVGGGGEARMLTPQVSQQVAELLALVTLPLPLSSSLEGQ